jgi:hypothetical protein
MDNNEFPTREQIKAAFEIIALVGQMIRECPEGQIPAGELYARLMDKVSLESFQSIIRTLVKTNLITDKNHLLTWIGPIGPEGK